MSEGERISRSVAGAFLAAAVAAALMAGCAKPDDTRPCERYDRFDLIAVAKPGPPPAPRPPAPAVKPPAPVQRVPSLQKPKPAAPAPAPGGPRLDVPDVPGAPGATARQPAPTPSPSKTQKRRHHDADLCDD
ncbi:MULTISPECIES: hypothetical protein [unclassified Streptomyces]|uniref:hypothetical protein n=1 Tax=unclassified Streptomyces TaxID=2593676 RepID=UPI000AFC3477|nr:hypothetical protein [Streptomyces sp. TSRI0281]